MSELKCCPFCGGEAVIQKLSDSTLSFAVCVDCRMRTPTLQDGKTAMRVWNTRKPMDNIVKKLEEKTEFLKDCTKYGNESAEQQEKSYSTMMMYEVADLVDELIDIVKQEINNGLE